MEEFAGGVQFLKGFWFMEVPGGVHPLAFCWGGWKNGGGICFCWGAFRQFSAFGPLGLLWLPNMLWMIWLDLVASMALRFISS